MAKKKAKKVVKKAKKAAKKATKKEKTLVASFVKRNALNPWPQNQGFFISRMSF